MAHQDLDKALSLEDCLAMARENSGKMLIGRDKLKAAKMRYWEKKRDILPPLSFDLKAREGILPGDTFPNGTFRGISGHLNSDFPILDGGAKFKTLAQTRKAYQQARLEHKKTAMDLNYAVRQTYYQLAEALLQVELQTVMEKKAQEILGKAEELAKKGMLKPMELSGIRLQAMEVHEQTVALDERLLLLQLAMKQLLNVYPDHPLKIKTDMAYVEPPLQLDRSLQLAYQHRPELRQLDLSEQIARLGKEAARAQNGLTVSINSSVGLKGEAFNSAPEGIQSRIDAVLGIKCSMPLGPHTLKYEPDFHKQVPDVGDTTPQVYNEHRAILEFYNNTAERGDLEASIGYHESASNAEDLRKSTATDIGNAIMRLEKARNQMGRAQMDFQLSQQRLKVALSQGQSEQGLSINDEMGQYVAASESAKRLVSARYSLFSQFNQLNRMIGIDDYWDPHTGDAHDPLPGQDKSDRQWFEFWRDGMLEQDANELNGAPYEDYLQAADDSLSWAQFIQSKDAYPLLHYVPEYPKLSVSGEYRSRFSANRETVDLGANVQPITRNITVTVGPLAVESRILIDPDDTSNVLSLLGRPYRQYDDNYVALYQRLLTTLRLQLSRNVSTYATLGVYDSVLGGYKSPREMTSGPVLKQDFETFLNEAYVHMLDIAGIDGWAIKAGRQFLDFDFGILFNDKNKQHDFDMVQTTYTQNPWMFQVFYINPVLNNLHEHYTDGDIPDSHGGYVRYKGDTWRYTFAYVGNNEGRDFEAPLSLFNQLLWDPFPRLETESMVTYQLGKLPDLEDQHQSALGMDFSAKYKFEMPMRPQLGSEFFLGQGGKEGSKKDFAALLNTDDQGYIVQTIYTNTVFLRSFLNLQATKNSSLTLQHYYFSQYRSRQQIISNFTVDETGIFIPTNGHNKDIGHEFDAIHEWNLMDNLKSQMVAAWFLPGHAYGQNPDLPFPGAGWQKVAFRLRWQILFNF